MDNIKKFAPYVILALAFLLRLWALGAESAWIDEAYSIVLARHPIIEIIHGTAADQHPPLYYLVLHYWLSVGEKILDNDPQGLVVYARFLSVALGVLHVGQVLFLGRKIGGDWLGWGASFLLAISPFHVWYSQEIRQYMLLASLTTAATEFLWDSLHGRNRLLLYWLTATLSIYTHYFAVFIFIAHGLIVMIWAFQKGEHNQFFHWMISMVALAGAFMPWLPTALDQFRFHTMSWIGEPVAGDVRDIILRMLLGSGVLVLPGWARWVCLVAILAGFVMWFRLWYWRTDGKTRDGYRFILLWGLTPFLIISLVAIIYPIFQFKQYLILLAPILLLAASIITILQSPWRQLIASGFVVAALISLVYQQVSQTKDDWQGAASYLQQHVSVGELVYGNPAASSLALTLYGGMPGTYLGYPPGYDILRGGWEGEALTQSIVERQMEISTFRIDRVWLVEFAPEFWDPQGFIIGWLYENGTMVDEQQFGKIRIRQFDLARMEP